MFLNQHPATTPVQTPDQDVGLKELWYAERGLLDMFQDDPKDIIAFIKECSTADLHQFDTVHGVEQEVEVFRAILAHPKCDRATALNIYSACEPAYFERRFAKGMTADDFEDEEERVYLAILAEAQQRLLVRQSWRGRYAIKAADFWSARPMSNPVNFEHFKLTPTALRPTKNEDAVSSIIYEYSIIGLSFDAWRLRN